MKLKAELSVSSNPINIPTKQTIQINLGQNSYVYGKRGKQSLQGEYEFAPEV